jgi:hypothetical protein
MGEEIITANGFAKLLSAKALKDSATPVLRELVTKTENDSAVVINKPFKKPIPCSEVHGMAVYPITSIDVEFALRPDFCTFSFAARIYLKGNVAGEKSVPMHWKSHLDKVVFNDKENKVKMNDDFHWPELCFKNKKDFNYFKESIEAIKEEARKIINALNK